MLDPHSTPGTIDNPEKHEPEPVNIDKHRHEDTEKGETWRQLAEFVDKHGPRFTGTQHLERAIDDRVNHLRNVVGNSQVHVEDFQVPLWIRGHADVVLLDAWTGGRNKTLAGLALGFSVGTPNNTGIIAEAIVVRSFEELSAKKTDEVQGKVVVYNQDYVDYGSTVRYRSNGASEAAAKGAVAALIRSVTGRSLYTPHTGMMRYDSRYGKIPAISITSEDAELMWRKQQRGNASLFHMHCRVGEKLRVYVRSTARLSETKSTSRNTVAELKGAKNSHEVVIIGGHIDSWDVGQGAMDDGGGAAISWRVPEVLKALNLQPDRTIRTVLFSAEEMGIIGGRLYYNIHKRESSRIQFIMESDLGTFTPLGLSSPTKNLQSSSSRVL
ncbi:hypothetical protein BIW11_04527 [Tropilaelaps mercedesae]|uniref:Carboxypeptidase Q n=1 Tax=Tropilaelaps mercedesae TaxID=418985 RepID=A0A1V9X4V7_9ACAR|nr:hypothetical protein BIW11_04527 [Tropilaelaps mercedesae]